jgi:glutamine amidotransferase
MIAIIDYGMGNLRSVQKALERVGARADIIESPSEAARADALVLPGVGAFGQAMERLAASGFDDLCRAWTREDRPFLGICLGLQLLFCESEEFGPVKGLAIVPGRVVRFSGPAFEPHDGNPGLKIPHMGWNRITVVRPHPVVAGLPADAMTYFVHSYYPVPDDPQWTVLTSHHGLDFTAAVGRGNLFASQFHPEKSGDVGLGMLANFVALVGAGEERP